MELEIAVDGEDVDLRRISEGQGPPAQDARCDWALRIETRARELLGSDPKQVRKVDSESSSRRLAARIGRHPGIVD